MLGKIRKYLLSFPIFESRNINCDFLSEKQGSLALYSEDGEVVLKEYASGDSLRQFIFSLRYRAPYGFKAEENEKINSFFCDFAALVEKNSEAGRLPDLGDGKDTQSMEILENAHVKNTNVSDCVYEMKMRAVYYQTCKL